MLIEERTARFGELLRGFRVTAGLSQEVLAERSCVSVQSISALERGVRRAPYRETVAMLAEALRLDPEERRAFEASAQTARRLRTLVSDQLSAPPLGTDRGAGPDGLPIVYPTPERVAAMLAFAEREAEDVLGTAPRSLAPFTVGTAAVVAVTAGCRPEQFPILLAALTIALARDGDGHAAAASQLVRPVILVNGRVAHAVGVSADGNVPGSGRPANAAIARAFGLVFQPGMPAYCFSEDDGETLWQSYAQSKGFPRRISTVTLFFIDGILPVIDSTSREPLPLCRSFARVVRAVVPARTSASHRMVLALGAEHQLILFRARWSKERTINEIKRLAERNLPLEIIRSAGRVSNVSGILSSAGGWHRHPPVTVAL